MDTFLKENLITTKNAAELSGYTSDYLARLARSGKIVGKKIGHSWLVDTESLARFSEEQGDRKIDYSRELARTREAEYRAHHSLLNQVTNVPVQTRYISQLDVAKSPLRSNIFAFSVAALVLISAAFVARAGVIQRLAEGTGSLAFGIASGFSEVSGDISSYIVSRAGAMDDGIRAQSANAIAYRSLSSSRTTSSPEEFNFFPARPLSFFENTPTRSFTTLVSIPAAPAPTPARDLETLRASVSATYAFLTTPSRIARTLADMFVAFGAAIIDTAHFAIRADVALAYTFGNIAPEGARAITALLGNTGDLLARATARVPALATSLYLRAIDAPSTLAPSIASAVFDAEYGAALRFVALADTTAARYVALISSTGNLAYEGASGIRSFALALRSLGEAGPATLENAYLGALGKGALALHSLKGEGVLAAVLPALSAGEQAALFTYQTVRGFFDSATGALAALFGTSSNVAIVSSPSPTVLPFATSTTSVGAPQPTAPPPASVLPTPTLTPRIAAVTNNYPTYTTVVKGVSEDFMNQSLASLRTGILATVAGMVQPVAAQTVTNATTIQQVNMIQDLSNLIVRNGDFRGGIFDNGIRVSATDGNFTNLTGGSTTLSSLTTSGATSLATTTITGSLTTTGSVGIGTTSPSDTFALNGPAYFAQISAPSVTTNRLYNSGGLLYFNGTQLGAGGGGTSSWATTTSQVAGQLINYSLNTTDIVAIGNTSTTTAPFWFNPNTTTGYFSGKLGIGTTSPYAKLSVVGETVSSYFTATSTTASSFVGGVNTSGTTGGYKIDGNLILTASSTNYATLLGYQAGSALRSVNVQNTAIGYQALRLASSATLNEASFNTAVGFKALTTNTTGEYNTAVGSMALYLNNIGSHNTAIGESALYQNLSGDYNTAVGQNALITNTTGYDNTAVGKDALRSNNVGYGNTAIGKNALFINDTGVANTAVGIDALYFNKAGSFNTILGYQAGVGVFNQTVPQNNVFLGYRSGYANTTGSNNIFLGYQAASTTTSGSNNIVIGYDIDSPSPTSANTLNIGNLIFGTGIDGTNTTLSSGNVGIGTTSPYAKLSVVGETVSSYFTATSTTATSTFSGGVSIGGNNGLNVLSNGQAMIGTNTIPGSGAVLTIRNTAGLSDTLQIDSASADYQMTLSDSYTDATNKDAAILMAHYSNSSEESIPLVSGRAQSSSNILFIGGNDIITGTYNAATELRFLTGATNTTLNGTTRMLIDSSGNVGIGTSSPTARLTVSATSTSATVPLFEALANNGTGTTTQMVILANGNMGIGTTSPYAKLSVVGETVSSYFTATSTTARSIFSGYASFGTTTAGARYNFGGAGQGSYLGAAALMTLVVDSGADWNLIYGNNAVAQSSWLANYMDNTGNLWFGNTTNFGILGIKTGTGAVAINSTANAAPKADLDIFSASGSSSNPKLYFSKEGVPGVGMTFGEINFYGTVIATNAARIVATNNAFLNDGSFDFYVGNNAGTRALTIANTGNVGIGTTSPYAKLSVVGETVSSYFTATSTTANGFAGALGSASLPTHSFVGDSNTGIYSSGADIINFSAGGTNQFTLGTGNAVFLQPIQALSLGSASLPRFSFNTDSNTGIFSSGADTLNITTGGATSTTFTSTGFVGIGTTSPYAKLSVVGETVSSYFTATSTTATTSIAGTLSVGSTTPASSALFSVGTSSPLLHIDKTSGRVGIGTSAPSQALDVQGDIFLKAGNVIRFGASSGGGLADASGNVYLNMNTNGGIPYFTNNISGLSLLGPNLWLDSGSIAQVATRFYITTTADSQIAQITRARASQTGDLLQFQDSSANVMSVFNKSGFLGIGTTSPYARLSVVGETVSSYFTATSTTATSTFNGGFAVGTGISPSGLVYDRSTGRVGISTASPSALFTINSTAPFTVTSAGVITGGAGVTSVIGDVAFSGSGGVYGNAGTLNLGGNSSDVIIYPQNHTDTSGTIEPILVGNGASFAPTSGTGVYNFMSLNPVINQTGGANGVTRGIYINPTLTSATDFRAIETTKGNVIFGSTSGNVGIGTTSPYAKLSVVGETVSSYFTATSTTATSTFMGGITIGTTTPSQTTMLNVLSWFTTGPSVLIEQIGASNSNIQQRHARGSVGAPTALLSGDQIGKFTYSGYGTTGYANNATAQIQAVAGENFTDSAQGTYFKFLTTPIGSITAAEVMRIDTTGNVGIGTTSPYARLSVAGETVSSYFTATSTTATSTFGGFIDVNGTGTNATSTIASNLWVKGTLRAAVSYVGDLIFANDFRFTEGDLSAPMQTLNLKNQFGSTTITFLDNGNVGIGTTTPDHMLTVAGDIAATAFVNTSTRSAKTDITYTTESSTEDMLNQLVNLKVATYRYKIEDQGNLRLGLIAEDVQTIAPEILSVDGKGVDLYKLATFTLSGVQALAAKVDTQNMRLTSLEERVVALESGAVSSTSGSPVSFSSSTIASALESFGVLIQKGIAQFNTLVFRQLVASSDADGTSSAGSVTILAGNTVAQVNNSLVSPSTKIFITFNSQVTGSWWVSDKAAGSFRVVLSAPQTSDASFDYFLVQTEGQIATSTSEVGGSQTSLIDVTPPVITLLGDNPVYLSIGGTYVEPGITVTDNTDPSTAFGAGGLLAYSTFVDGIQMETSSATIDTSSQTTHIITYSATDTAGNLATATRSVIVGSSPDGSQTSNTDSGSLTSPSSTDTTPPVVTLVGDAAMQITVGGTFTDPGATAMDDIDGDLTANIVVTGTVDIATEGLYTLTYTATDAADNSGTASRVVTVIASVATTTSTSTTI
jgi:hypothetical protein